VLGELIDALREKRHLHLRRTRVALMCAVIGDDLFFRFSVQHDLLSDGPPRPQSTCNLRQPQELFTYRDNLTRPETECPASTKRRCPSFNAGRPALNIERPPFSDGRPGASVGCPGMSAGRRGTSLKRPTFAPGRRELSPERPEFISGRSGTNSGRSSFAPKSTVIVCSSTTYAHPRANMGEKGGDRPARLTVMRQAVQCADARRCEGVPMCMCGPVAEPGMAALKAVKGMPLARRYAMSD
jgi:hypothetical protein